MTQRNKEILQALMARYIELGISEQIDYQKFYLYSIITHSTAIEGSTVTEVEAQLLFDEGITSNKRTMVEQMMNLDLKSAYEYGMEWIKQHRPITIEWLISLAGKVMAHTGSEYHSAGGDFDAAKGEIRKLNVTAGAGGKSYMSYIKVPRRLEEFCNELNARRKAVFKTDIAAIYELSFWAHYELVTIHPWADGNGRTSRLLMNLLQMEYDVLPTKVLKEDKAEYIKSLIDTREEEDVNLFGDCMTELHCRHLKSDIEQYLVSVNDEKSGQKTAKVDRKGGQKTREAIISLIKEDENITSTEMANALGINRSAVSKHLKRLQDEGVIQRIGPDKGGKWVISITGDSPR